MRLGSGKPTRSTFAVADDLVAAREALASALKAMAEWERTAPDGDPEQRRRHRGELSRAVKMAERDFARARAREFGVA
jgi:hypothetical protein